MAANGLIIGQAPFGLRYAAALALLAFLPGWAWLPSIPAGASERGMLAAGLSLALTILGTILAVYLPGPLTVTQLLLVMNGISGLGLVWMAWRSAPAADPSQGPGNDPGWFWKKPGFPILLLIAALLLLAAALRLPRLSYAEFHEDEAEALMLGTRLLQGEDYALFLHRKGPAQVLVPVAFWLLSGHLTEASARLPFALSSLLSAAALFFIGRRWFSSPTAGLVAGLLWAINGYAIAFGRMVQYQALIFFLGPLAIYCLFLARPGPPRASLMAGYGLPLTAAVLLAASLLAHFDALLLLPAAAYLGWSALRQDRPARRWLAHPSLVALVLLVGLLAVFYVPYLLDPEFSHTAAYLSGSRIKPGLLYNNLRLLVQLDRDYSSRFYLPLLALGLLGLAVWQNRILPNPWRWLSAGLGLLLVTTVGWPAAWRLGSLSLAVLPWLLFGLIFFWFNRGTPARAAWLLFGAPFLGYIFLVDDPRTHLYILYPGAVLLAGAGWQAIQRAGRPAETAPAHFQSAHLPIFQFSLVPLFPLSFAALLALGVASLVTAVVVYEGAIFLSTESALAGLQQRWESSAWETVYKDLPGPRKYFGYPKREGWKAIGALRAQGLFPGDFRSVNEDFVLPIWYNYGQPRSCYDTPAYFFVRLAEGDTRVEAVPTAGYGEVGQIKREGEIRLRIFAAGASPADRPTVYSLESLEADFDERATPTQFIRQAKPSRPVAVQFGPAIQFQGYDLPTTVVAPGETLYLDLYWQALADPQADYRAFAHLTDGAHLWGQQDDTPVCRLPTSVWRAGQRGVGQFRLPVAADTPPGRYPLIIGLYQAETLERLKITGGAAKVGDDFLWLGDIEVQPR